MRQPWIHNAKTDSWLILSPPFVILLLVMVFQKQLALVESEFSLYTWLILIVSVDVAHVYSTLFKTYFVKDEFRKRKLLYLGIPAVSLLLGIFLYQFGALFFWAGLALIAVFHFIRQQYGFMRLYSRFEPGGIFKTMDSLAVYSATVFPMLYWFCTPRKFNWFVEDEFGWFGNFIVFLPFVTILYCLILIIWVAKTVFLFIRYREFNLPKNLLISGTYLSWYFGIVYFNNDLIFTLLNVISHGIPYIALIYIREIEQKTPLQLKKLSVFRNTFGILLFVLIILGFAFVEEFLWEILIWKEHFSLDSVKIADAFYPVLIPVLAVPQLTHYLLDGFIWRRPKKKV